MPAADARIGIPASLTGRANSDIEGQPAWIGRQCLDHIGLGRAVQINSRRVTYLHDGRLVACARTHSKQRGGQRD